MPPETERRGKKTGIRETGWQGLANQFEQPIYQLIQHLRTEGHDPRAEAIEGNRSDLRNLHPGGFGQHFRRQRHRQRESSFLGLTCNRHGDYRLGLPVEQVVAEDENRPQPGLLATSDGVQVRPIDLTPQYSGQAWSPKPCSASSVSSLGSILANSRASRVRFSRSLSRFTADWSARLRFAYLPSRTHRSRSATVLCSKVTAIFCTTPLV